MPVTSQNYKKYQAAIAKASQDPNYDRSKLSALQGALNSFLENASDEDLNPNTEQYGPPVAPPVPPKPIGDRKDLAGYYFNPSVDEFRSEIQNPDIRKRIGVNEGFKPLTDDAASQDYDTMGMPVSRGASELTEDSEEYKKYSEAKWQQEHTRDPSLQRYEDIDTLQSPFNKALGAVVKYAPPAALGLEKTVGLGIPRRAAATIAGNTPDSAADVEYDAMGAPLGPYHPEKSARVEQGIKQLESLSPTAGVLAQVGGYLVPMAPANAAAKGLTGVLGYAGRGALGKIATGALTGGAVASGEGFIQDVMENPEMSASEHLNRFIPRLGWGVLGGTVFDAASQLAGKTRMAFNESPSFDKVKNLRDVGGGTHVLKGVEAPPAVNENLAQALKGREFKHAEDIAAMKVAPKIKESLQNQEQAAFKKSGDELEAYLNQPEIANARENMRPVAEGILDMFKKGTLEGAVTGDIKHVNPEAVNTFKKVLGTIGETAHMNPNEAALFAKNNNGIILDHEHMKALGMPAQEGKVAVYIPSKTSPRALLEMEQMIDDKLKMAGTEGGINNPIWKNINKNIKSVRDKFGSTPEFSQPPEPFKPASSTENQTGVINPQKQVTVTERRSPNRPTDEQWQAMKKPEGIDRNTPISEMPPSKEGPYDFIEPSINPHNTEPPPIPSDPVPMNEVRGNKRYQEPSASEYAKMQSGENVDKSGNGYAMLFGPEDVAPGYRLRSNPNEISSLNKLLENETALENIYKANPGISEAEASDIFLAQSRLKPGETNYTPEFPVDQSEKTGWGSPFEKTRSGRVKSPFTPERIGKNYSEWSPNEDLYTANPPESISAESVKSEAPKSLFPDVPDQQGVANKSEFAKANQQEAVGKVKELVDTTDKLADNLSPEEVDAIHSYTNRRGDKVGTEAWKSATKKLTVENPTKGGTLFHGTRLPKANIDEILKTGKVHFDKPTSTSFNDGIASSMAYSRANRGDAVVFEIPEVDNGVSLASKKLGVHGTSMEREVLLNDKHFEVSGSKKNKDGDLVISLKQVKPKKQIPEATLDDGTKVYGLSAVQRKHHEAMKKVQDAEKLAGAGSEGSAHNRVLKFKSGPGNPYNDEVIAAEADKLGLRQELEEVAATRDFPQLRARAWGGGNTGPLNALKDFIGLRVDPILGAIAGDPANPFTAPPNTPQGRIQRYLFRTAPSNLLNQQGGLGFARFGNELVDYERDKK